MICPHCKKETNAPEFCGACNGVLPVEESLDYFSILGFPRRTLNVDPVDLEKRFFALSKKFHPDRFASRGGLQVQLSHDWSSAINNAYRTLKDPVSRAKYVVEQDLGSVEETSARVPPDMAELLFELHDVLDTIRETPDNPPAAAVTEIKNAEKDLRGKVKSLEDELKNEFVRYDAAPDPQSVRKMKELLSERSYIASFLRQIDSVFPE